MTRSTVLSAYTLRDHDDTIGFSSCCNEAIRNTPILSLLSKLNIRKRKSTMIIVVEKILFKSNDDWNVTYIKSRGHD